MIKKLFLLMFLALATATIPQPGPTTFYTLEARIAEAEIVVVGRIAEIKTTVIVPPGGRAKEGYTDPNGRNLFAIKIDVEESLKGNPNDIRAGLTPIERLGFDKRWQQWKDAGTTMIFFIGRNVKNLESEGWSRRWTTLRLGPSVEDEKTWHDPMRSLPVFSSNFSALKTAAEALHRAREYGRESRGVQRIHMMRVPNSFGRSIGQGGGHSWDNLMLPVDQQLETTAKRMIMEPFTYVRNATSSDASPNTNAKLNGADAIRYFKSKDNAALLRLLLNDNSGPPPQNADVQAKAFEVLLHWNEDCPLPNAAPRITELDLANTNAGDREVERLAAFPNLKKLELTNTKVGARGLRALRGLKNLATISLGYDQLTDDAVRALGENGMLHTIPWVFGPGQNRAPSDDKIVEVLLAWTKVGDRSLKFIGKCDKLEWMDLRDTMITDEGLKNLSALTKLTKLFLGGTKVSRAGVDKLRAALPKCEIQWPLPTGH